MRFSGAEEEEEEVILGFILRKGRASGRETEEEENRMLDEDE